MDTTRTDQLTEMDPDWMGTRKWRYVANDGSEHWIKRYKDSDQFMVMLRGGGQTHDTLESAIDAVEDQADLRAAPEREMSDHGIRIGAEAQKAAFRAEQRGSSSEAADDGNCSGCGGPTSVAGERCDTCSQ